MVQEATRIQKKYQETISIFKIAGKRMPFFQPLFDTISSNFITTPSLYDINIWK